MKYTNILLLPVLGLFFLMGCTETGYKSQSRKICSPTSQSDCIYILQLFEQGERTKLIISDTPWDEQHHVSSGDIVFDPQVPFLYRQEENEGVLVIFTDMRPVQNLSNQMNIPIKVIQLTEEGLDEIRSEMKDMGLFTI